MPDQSGATVETATEPQKAVTGPPSREERIRQRAYELYEQRNGELGYADEDWYRAESEITSSPTPTPNG
jgi:hypothetical protein